MARLGGPAPAGASAQEWIRSLQERRYRAAYWPLAEDAPASQVDDYVRAAADFDIVIAEVGAWSNPIAPDAAARRAALDLCKRRLGLAERIGALCCVNIAGACGEQWDGPHPENLSDATFDRIVASVQEIIDAVRPKTTAYSLEPMPWIFPDSPESYLKLIAAIDRPAFAAHLDPVNIINSPERYFHNGELIRRSFRLLGAHIRSCHAKDILLSGKLTVHLDEVRPGLGGLDYGALLTEAERLNANLPIMLEHLGEEDEYRLAAEYVRSVAERHGVTL